MIEYIQSNHLIKQFLISVLLFIGYQLLRRLTNKWLNSIVDKKHVSLQRKQFILKSFQVVSLVMFIGLSAVVLDIGFGDISLFLSSIFAVLGVALFAQWSILSNLTASVLIFFFFPYRIGDKIQVLEKDADIRGKIIDITMFHVLIRHEDGDEISYPNNMILQKGVAKLAHNYNSSVLPCNVDVPQKSSVPNE